MASPKVQMSMRLNAVEKRPFPPRVPPAAPDSSVVLRFLDARSSEEIIPILLHEIAGMGFERAFAAHADLEAGRLAPRESFQCSTAYLERFRLSLYAPRSPLVKALHRRQPAVIDNASLRHRALFVSPLIFGSGSPCWEASASRVCLAQENQRSARPLNYEQQHCPTCLIRGYACLVCVELPHPEASTAQLQGIIELAGRFLARLYKREHYYKRMTEMEETIHQMQAVMRSMSDPVVLTDAEHRVVLHNRAADRFFSVPENASAGLIRAVELNNLLFSAALSSISVSGGEQHSRDLTLVDALDGEELLFEAIIAPGVAQEGRSAGFVTVMRDVTDLRRADQELRANYEKLAEAEESLRVDRDRLNLIIENVGDPIVVYDGAARPVMLDPRAQELFDEGDKGGAARLTNLAKLEAWITSFTFSFLDRQTTALNLINPETRSEVEYEARSGKIYDERGQTAFTVTVLRDYTAWRRIEQLRLERQMLQVEKFAAAGRLAATLAHEINNPLESIKNAIFVLGDHVKQQGQPFYQILDSESSRLARIVRQMLGLYRGREAARPTSINALLEDTLAVLDRQFQRNSIQVVFEPGELPEAMVAPDQLRQVFSNLLINAADSMPAGGQLRVRSRVFRGAGRAYVRVTVADTGIGIPAEMAQSIFEPFVTTKGDRGTGLGLWIVRGIMTDHGGRVRVRSKRGRGTVFSLSFPLASDEVER